MPVSFPLEDKHVVNKHYVIRKKAMMPHRKNVLKWCILMYQVIGLRQTHGIKNLTLKGAKNLWVLQSSGKCNTTVGNYLDH